MEPRVVVVTGGTRGIGAALAERFVSEGDHVIVSARQDNGLADSLGERARFCRADAAVHEDHVRLVDAVLGWHGRLDVFINNAGFSKWMPLDQVTETFCTEMLAVNLQSVLWGCQQAARAMVNGGCILNVSSMAGKRGTANNAVYCAAKFGVNGLTQALAKELGPRGIRVNAVCPVLVRTPGLLDALAEPFSPAKGDPEAFLADFTRANAALGALPDAAQVAEFCAMLTKASAITGQCVNVDCGVFPQ